MFSSKDLVPCNLSECKLVASYPKLHVRRGNKTVNYTEATSEEIKDELHRLGFHIPKGLNNSLDLLYIRYELLEKALKDCMKNRDLKLPRFNSIGEEIF